MDLTPEQTETLVTTGVQIIGMVISTVLPIIGGSAVIAAITPQAKKNIGLITVRAIIDILGFNFGNAKNIEKDTKTDKN